MIYRLIACCTILWGMPVIAQHKCGMGDTTPVPYAIFGPDRLLVSGRDTIVTPLQRCLVYSCKEDRIVCTSRSNDTLWITHVADRLILFKLFYAGAGKKVKGCDVLLQLHDKSLLVLNSKNGKVKPVSVKDLSRRVVKKAS